MSSKIGKGRRSVFREHGLEDDFSDRSKSRSSSRSRDGDEGADDTNDDGDKVSLAETESHTSPRAGSGFSNNLLDGLHSERQDSTNSTTTQIDPDRRESSTPSRRWYSKLADATPRPRLKSISAPSSGAVSVAQRFTMVAMLVAIVIPLLSYRNGHIVMDVNGADAGPVVRPRDTSPTDVCARWSFQYTSLNGTLYMFGGRSKSDPDQTQNQWNNNFASLDLTKDWDTDSPAFKGLEVPDGPPAVSMGALWRDYGSLFLYGGQFSDAPYVDPGPESLWKYSVADGTWLELTSPQTMDGNFSEPGGQPVRRAAEGSWISIPELGVSYWFGGLLNWATVPGWSRSTPRVYLKSLLEYTHPGYTNSGVDELSENIGAGTEGAFRNITTGGVQDDGFSERADGVLVYVPGWGEKGVLIGLAGGLTETFTEDLNTLDVYDIANSKWFHQETSGDTPSVRVNPCAVVAAPSDASSFQIYLFGGQNLPFGDQTQYNDMYILTIPSFTWIKVDRSDSTPSPRVGHACTMQDGQMVLVGGTATDMGCDSSDVYVFDASSLTWQDSFKAADHSADFGAGNMVLAGSYGYRVPEPVRDVIGGDEDGGATQTTPAAGPATGGPFATGTPPVFTVTQPGATQTVTQGGGAAPTNESPEDDSGGDGGSSVNPGLIAAGVVAGVASALALYLGFCAYLYRKQVRAYKQHLAVANRYSGASVGSLDAATALFGGGLRSSRPRPDRCQSASSNDTFGWVGTGDMSDPRWLTEPKWLFDDQSSSSATGLGTRASGSGNVSGGSSSYYGAGAGRPHQQQQSSQYSSDKRPRSSGSDGSAEALLNGQEPSFVNVVFSPRRALRVVNGLEE